MRPVAVAIVLLGLALAAGLALATDMDAPGLVILVVLALVGGMALAIVRKSGVGVVQPATCRDCGGLVSPNAPYCKHCGAHLADSA